MTENASQCCDSKAASSVSVGHLEQTADSSGCEAATHSSGVLTDTHTLHSVHRVATTSVLRDPLSGGAAQVLPGAHLCWWRSSTQCCRHGAQHAVLMRTHHAARGAAGTLNTHLPTDLHDLGTVRRGTESAILLKENKLPRTINSTDITCPSEHVGKTLNILNNFRSTVALEGEPLGLTQLMKMHITLQDGAKPTYVRPYPMSHFNQKLADEAVTEMLNQKVIEPSISPFNAPLILVKKKSGKVRPVIDYRRLNEVTVADKHPLPKISNILQHLEGTRLYSTVDMRSAFWQNCSSKRGPPPDGIYPQWTCLSVLPHAFWAPQQPLCF